MVELAIDLGGTSIKIGLISGAAVVDSVELPNTSHRRDLDGVVTAVASLTERTGVGLDTLGGVGIAVPGVVDAAGTGLLSAQGKYGYAMGLDLRGWAVRRWGRPTVVENDGRAALLGEAAHGCAQGDQDVVIIVLGTGIGTAAMVGGRLLRGRSGHAGILGGHVTVDLDGPPCPCGNVGCAEAMASTWALPGLLARQRGHDAADGPGGSSGAGPADFRALCTEPFGDTAAAEGARREAVRVWGATAVTLCHAYDPACLVLSGGVLRAGPWVADGIERYVAAHLWSSVPRPRVAVSADPTVSVLLGLAHAARAQAGDE